MSAATQIQTGSLAGRTEPSCCGQDAPSVAEAAPQKQSAERQPAPTPQTTRDNPNGRRCGGGLSPRDGGSYGQLVPVSERDFCLALATCGSAGGGGLVVSTVNLEGGG